MKKLLFFLLLFLPNLLMAGPQLLSERHAMLRTAVSGRYLLLPVEERGICQCEHCRG